MLIEKTAGTPKYETLWSCGTAQELVNCRDFYVLLEKFCNTIVEDLPEYSVFLNRYFNDEGYVDIWRIPHLIIDAVQHNLKSHKILEEEAFRIMFHRFISELYNYCLMECQFGYPVYLAKAEARDVVQAFRTRQSQVNALTDIFVQVMESIEIYEKMERGA